MCCGIWGKGGRPLSLKNSIVSLQGGEGCTYLIQWCIEDVNSVVHIISVRLFFKTMKNSRKGTFFVYLLNQSLSFQEKPDLGEKR